MPEAAPTAPLSLPPGFAARVVQWQRHSGRHDLPWQHPREPYRVWVSEIMLQQTQVSTVLGYFGRFMQRFPDVAALARAPLDDVLGLWAGLGYYSRARNLHRCAQAIMEMHGGEFPRQAQDLAQLPGIGPSTAAAIAAFCFEERAAILDGNVKRVLARVLAFDEDLARAPAHRRLLDAATQALPPAADMPAYTQGLMDLGATLCTPRRPACAACPVSDTCQAHEQGRTQTLPVKSRALRRGHRESWWMWLQAGDAWLLAPRPPQGIWGGLWVPLEFPDEASCRDALPALAPQAVHAWPSQRHVLTHLDWVLHAVHVTLNGPQAAQGLCQARGARWFAAPELAAVGLPAPFRRQLEAQPSLTMPF